MSIIDDDKLQNGIQNQNFKARKKEKRNSKISKKNLFLFFQNYRNSNNI